MLLLLYLSRKLLFAVLAFFRDGSGEILSPYSIKKFSLAGKTVKSEFGFNYGFIETDVPYFPLRRVHRLQLTPRVALIDYSKLEALLSTIMKASMKGKSRFYIFNR